MVTDLSTIHPELQRLAKIMPRISYNRASVMLIRLLSSLQPKPVPPHKLKIEQIAIQSRDQKYNIRLRIYRPAAISSPVPAMVWIHGGGFVIGKPGMDDACLFQFVQELGIVIVSVDYRLAPEHPFPTPLEDAYTALEWVSTHAQRLGVDPDRIAVGGQSAGGGLAACLAQLAHDRRKVQPIFQMLVYPMLDDESAIRSDLANMEYIGWTQANNRFGWESYLNQAPGTKPVPPYSVAARRDDLTGLPPAWIGVGSLDLFFAEDVTYALKLRDCGVEYELVTIPGAFHGFDVLDPHLPVVQDFRKSQITALKKYLFPQRLPS